MILTSVTYEAVSLSQTDNRNSAFPDSVTVYFALISASYFHIRLLQPRSMIVLYLVVSCVAGVSAYGEGEGRRSGPLAGTLSSVGAGGEQAPPLYRPGSQAYVVSQFVKPKPPHQYWEEETSQSLVPENRNCLLCESQDSGACRAMPSCVYCEATVTALCERSTPCLRCTVIKNPFFKCVPGEKYMDECDSCRCTDGHAGWCSNQFCEFRSLHIYALKLSDGEFY